MLDISYTAFFRIWAVLTFTAKSMCSLYQGSFLVRQLGRKKERRGGDHWFHKESRSSQSEISPPQKFPSYLKQSRFLLHTETCTIHTNNSLDPLYLPGRWVTWISENYLTDRSTRAVMRMLRLGMKLKTDRLTPQWNRFTCSSREVSAAHTEPLFSKNKFDFEVLYVAVPWWEKFLLETCGSVGDCVWGMTLC